MATHGTKGKTERSFLAPSWTQHRHLVTEHTTHKISQAFYWPNMRQVIQEMCRKCDRCTVRKPPLKNNRTPLKQHLVGEPMQCIAINILPRTRQGNRFVLVISDYFTKYAEAVALPDFEAETIAKAVVEQFICRFGTSRQLHSDTATNFESNVFQMFVNCLTFTKLEPLQETLKLTAWWRGSTGPSPPCWQCIVRANRLLRMSIYHTLC